ncbi:topoisomerase IV [Paraglaciecola aquimarina]|uniref:Topoisomerase IV n=1 Tax=Paraglaciecola aquimarina TaxID=1235557 RepID=A0ABU3STV7_9ALTE|nr:topoisomerase IV [Paraglaciecola aquimarina]MDU0353440.1 topoisomerase IV [Paraglaciecola aquimarina]
MKKVLTIATLCASTCFNAQAEVRINGFANFVAGMTSSNDVIYGYEDDVSFDDESLFAIQVSSDINSKMTATGQLVARGREDYDTSFEWAYLTYNATDNLNISVGRLRLPLFKYSASLDVGYSYHWVNAPRAVYEVDFNNIDGVRFDYSDYAGDWEYNLQGVFGKIQSKSDGADLDAKNTVAFSAEATYEWFKVRAVYGTASAFVDLKTSESLAPLDNALSNLTQLGLGSIEDDLQINDDKAEFIGFGLEVDMFDWFISGEVTQIEIENSFSPRDTAYYVTAGLRVGAFTPSITYESLDGNEDIKFLDQVPSLAEALQPAVSAIITGVQIPNMEEYDKLTLAVRYDYDSNIALKADVSKYSDKIDDTNDTTLVRFAVNYIF